MTVMNTLIKLEHLSKRFGDLEVLKDINIEIPYGKLIIIKGRFNCNFAIFVCPFDLILAKKSLKSYHSFFWNNVYIYYYGK